MAISLAQTGTALNVSGGTSGTITLTSVTAGNLLIVYADDIDGSGITFSVSDDKSNTWLEAVSNDNGGYSSSIWYCLNAAAGTTVITITASGSTAFLGQAQEYSGGVWSLDTTSFIDETTTTSHVCSASSSVIDIVGPDVVVCNSTTADGGNFGTRTPGSGYTGLSSPTAQAFWQYQIFSGAFLNERGAFTSANSKPTAACIAAFKVVAPCMSDASSSGCWWPCCTEEGVNTPSCAPVGSVGSESGSECTACGTTVISDSFSGTIDPAWVGAYGLCGTYGIGTPGFSVGSGTANFNDTSAMIRPFARPTLSGLCIQVSAKLTTLGSVAGGGVQGITLSYGRMFFARLGGSGDFGRQSCINADGCIGSGSVFANFGPTPADGDVIGIIIRDDGLAAQTFTVCYQVNGTTVRVEEGVRFCFPTTMYAGLFTTSLSTGSYDDFEVKTN